MRDVVVVVESPAKCKKIEEYLGRGYRCVATFGHLRYLDKIADGVTSLHFKEIDEKKGRIASLAKELKAASSVILATDSDREGEAIAWHVCDMFGLSTKTTPRMVFTEITQAAIDKAIKNCGVLDMSLVNAQKARQVLDMWIGFRISPLLWREISSGLSAGRCQTPALRLLCDKEREVNEAWDKCQLKYATVGYFGDKNVRFILDANLEEPLPFMETTREHSHVFGISAVKPSVHASPRPLTTSRLQQTASTQLRLSPKECMRHAQTLYEKGLITYMRTDSEAYSVDFTESLKKTITRRWGEQYYAEPKVLRVTGAQEAHEAIHPTDLRVQPKAEMAKELSPKCYRLYLLIYTQTLQSSMTAARGEVVCATLTAPMAQQYSATAERIVFEGWMAAEERETTDAEYNYFTSLQVGCILKYNSVQSTVKPYGVTTRLNESRVVKLLEEKGIGRPSTYASLLEKLVDRKYARVGDVRGIVHEVTDYYLEGLCVRAEKGRREFGAEKGRMIPMETGLAVENYLYGGDLHSLFSYDFTREMEVRLDEVANGTLEWDVLCREYDARLRALVKEEPEAEVKEGAKVRHLSKNLSVRMGRYGTYIFYKKPTMKKPCFFKTGKYSGDPWTCEAGDLVDWLCRTYRVEVE